MSDELQEPKAPPAPRARKVRINWLAVFVTFSSLGLAIAAGIFALVTHFKYRGAATERDAQKEEVVRERQKTEACATKASSLEQELSTTKSARVSTEKEMVDVRASAEATKAELEELRKQRAELEERLAAWRAITAKLQKMIDSGRLKVMTRDGRMILKLSTEVLFESGKADLATDGKSALREIAGILRQFPERPLMVGGHTDSFPVVNRSHKNNWELSTARALTVTEFLVANGLRPERLAAAGYGQYHPIASNKNEAGRKENRRIELVLLPNIADVPPLPPGLAPAAAPASAER